MPRQKFAKAPSLPSVTVWVAPTGNDANPGTKAAPFATLSAARDKVRAIIASQRPADGILVNVQAGIYPQSQSLEFLAADAGTATSPIVWRGVGGTVIVTGSRTMSPGDYQTVPGPQAALIPASVRSQVRMVDLAALGISTQAERTYNDTWTPMPAAIVADGRLLSNARYPNSGWLSVQPGSTGDASTPAVFAETDSTVLSWAGQSAGALLYAQPVYQWSTEIMPITSIDASAHTIITNTPSKWGTPSTTLGRYYIYNLLPALDSPDEYFIDHVAGKAYFIPGATTSVAILSDPIISCYQTAYIRFDGISVSEGRHAGYLVDESDHVTIRNCTVSHLNSGILLHKTTNSVIDSAHIHTVGCMGVLLDGGDRQTLTPANNILMHSEIHDFALQQKTYAPAVSILGVGQTVLHNNLYNTPHMIVGLSGNDHLVQDNWIHDGVLDNSDAGAFYTGRNWTDRGNVINRNWFSTIGNGGDQTSVYIDDCSSGFTVTNNIIVDGTRGLHHCGRDNLFENNVVIRATNRAWNINNWGGVNVDNQNTLRQRLTEVPYQSAAWLKYPHLANILDDEPETPKYNTVAYCIFADSVPGGSAGWGIVPQVDVIGNITTTADQLDLNTATRTAASSSPIIVGSGGFQGIDISHIYGCSVSAA